MKSDILKESPALAHLYEKAESSFRHLSEQSAFSAIALAVQESPFWKMAQEFEAIHALTQAQDRTWRYNRG